MKEVSVNNQMKLSQHFSLGELTKTKYVTEDGTVVCVECGRWNVE